jgi:peptidyl-prolyl cis-trans isomerase D
VLSAALASGASPSATPAEPGRQIRDSMLNAFRKGGVIQVVMGGVILLIILAFALEVRGPKKLGAFDTECAVQVDDSCVAPRDFMAAFQLSVRPDLTAKELKRLGVRKMILDGLVERELLTQEADRLGISISDEKVDEELALGRFHFSLPAERDGQLPMMTYVPVRHPDTNEFSYEIYQRMVKNYARMSTKDFKVYQTEELVAARMRDLSKLAARVSEAEVYAQFENENAKATVRVAQLDDDWFARFVTEIDDDAVRAYVTAHMVDVDTAFAALESTYVENCPVVSEILFAYPPAADEKDEQETRARAERAAAEAAKSPDSFEVLARIHSGAPSAAYGGKRGCLLASESEETGELYKAVEALAPGAMSPLLTTSRGLYLLRLDQRLPKEETANVGKLAVARPLAVLEAAKAKTRAFADGLKARIAAGAGMQDAVNELTKEALKTSPAVLHAGAKATAVAEAALESRERPQVDVSPSFSRGGVTSPLPNAVASGAAKQLAFTLEKPGDVYPDPIETHDGLAVLQLKDKEPAKREDFEKKKAEYVSEFKARAESEALTAFVGRLRKEHESKIRLNERFLEAVNASQDDS